MTTWSRRSPTMCGRTARRARAAVACGAAIAALGCDGDPTGAGGSAPPPPTLCESAVAVTVVASGDLPTFGWAPACGVTEVVVAREESGGTATAWQVRFPEARPAGPSIRYSQLPPRGETVVEPLPLARGATYRVTVRSVVDGAVVLGGGSTTFVF